MGIGCAALAAGRPSAAAGPCAAAPGRRPRLHPALGRVRGRARRRSRRPASPASPHWRAHGGVAIEGTGRDPAVQRGQRLRGDHRRLPAPVHPRRTHAPAPACHRAHPHGHPATQRDRRGQPHPPGHRPGRIPATGRADRVLRPAPARRRRRHLRPRTPGSRRSRRHPARIGDPGPRGVRPRLRPSPRRGSRTDARRPHLRTPRPSLSRVPSLARCRRSRMRDHQRTHPRGPAADRPRRRHPGRGQPARITGLVHLVLTRAAGRVQGQHPAQSRAPTPSQGNPARRAERPVDRRQQGPQRHPRRPGRRRSRPAPPRSRLHLRRTRPSTSSVPPGMPPAWTAYSKSAKTLQPHAEMPCVQALDDRLYGWQATLSTLQR